MCIYDRADYACGHQELGPMKAQCTRFWRECCTRSCDESFSHKIASLCTPCEAAAVKSRAAKGTVDQDIGPSDILNLTLHLNPFPTTSEKSRLEMDRSNASEHANVANHDDVKAYLNDCIKQYQQIHHLPAESIRISDSDSVGITGGMTADGPFNQGPGDRPRPGNHNLHDYQMQLMLLENQNKKRLMMARREVEERQATDHEAEQIMEWKGSLDTLAHEDAHDKKAVSPVVPDVPENDRKRGMRSADEFVMWSCGTSR